MNDTGPIPTSLKVVAGLFIVSGVLALIEVVLSLLGGRLSLNFGVLGLFIGPGLLRLSPGWRTVAVVYLVIGAILVPIAGLFFLSSSGPFSLTVFGQPMGNGSRELGLLFGVVSFALIVWQLHVLTRADVRSLFETADAEGSGPGNDRPI